MDTATRAGGRSGSPVRWRRPAHRLADHAVAGALAVGPVLAEAADAHHHEPRVARGERLVAQAPALERAGAEVLDQHVALRGQVGHDRLALGPAQVDDDERLVAEDARRVERLAVEALAHGAHRVALGGLDLDDLGAEVGEQAPAEGAGHGRAQLEDAVAGERARGGRGFRVCFRGVHGCRAGQRMYFWNFSRWALALFRPSRRRCSARSALPRIIASSMATCCCRPISARPGRMRMRRMSTWVFS